MLRYRAAMAARRYLDAQGFIDIETPMLYKSTPEGAREFLVPSRIHHGQFYALPQSPQLFKQMLMMAGFDRYYQIVKCFRDEDLRADRQPEFTQIDIETSFLDELEIRELMEGLVRTMFREALGVELPNPFPVMTYADAMRDYGSDKPDLRVPLKLTELTDLMRDGRLQGVPRRGGAGRTGASPRCASPAAARSRARRSTTTRRSSRSTAPAGLAYIKVNDAAEAERGRAAVADRQVPLAGGRCARSSSAPARRPATSIFFGADREKVVNDALGALRAKVGHDRGFAEPGWKPLWVVDFPMFEYDERAADLGCAAPSVHRAEGRARGAASRRDPGSALAKAYDVVLNGWEIGGGSVRIHRPEVQAKVFEALEISPEDQQKKFGFLLDALQYGAPPHGGIAFGLDRIVTLMAGAESIRDVIAFPKTQRGQDLLIDAPDAGDRAAAARPAHPGAARRARQAGLTAATNRRGRHAVHPARTLRRTARGVLPRAGGARCPARRRRRAAPAPRCRRSRLAELPPEARDVLALIRKGGPFRYDRDGVVFGNREQLLPAKPRGYYHEYTVPHAGREEPRRPPHRLRRRADRAGRVLLHRRPLPVVQEDPRMKLPDLSDLENAGVRRVARRRGGRSSRPRRPPGSRHLAVDLARASSKRALLAALAEGPAAARALRRQLGRARRLRSRTATGWARTARDRAHRALGRLPQGAPDRLGRPLEDILGEAAEFWRERHVPFWVFVA